MEKFPLNTEAPLGVVTAPSPLSNFLGEFGSADCAQFGVPVLSDQILDVILAA